MRMKLRMGRQKLKEAVTGNRMAKAALKHMKETLKSTSLNECLYLAFFSVMMTVKMAGFYEGQFVFNAALIFGVILLAVKVVLDKYDIRDYVLATLFILLGGIVYLYTGEKGLLICFAMMLGMKGVSIRKVFTCGAICSAIVLLIKVIGGAFGLIPEDYYASYRVGMGTELRHTFGYAHPNTMQISVLVLSIMVLYLITKYTEHIIIGSLLVLIFDAYIYMYSGSRTGLLVCLIYICINTWFYYKKNLGIIEKIACYCVYPVACIVSIAFPLILPDYMFAFLDDRFFTYRLSIAKYYYAYNNSSLFGIRLSNPEKIPYSLDMAYLYLFLQLGIVAFTVVSILTIYCVHKAVSKDKTMELAMFIGITIAGIWEPFLYNSSFKNILFVFAGAVIYKQMDGEDIRIQLLDRKKVLQGTISALVVAFLFGGAYLIMSKEPNAIYVNVEKPVINSEVTNTPIYLTLDEKDAIVNSGGIVLGYRNEHEPLYEHGIEVAKKEYRNKVLSFFMLGGLLGIAGYGLWNHYFLS